MQKPLGLRIAPAIFQQAIEFLLLSFKTQSVLVYLEDTDVFSKNVNNHMARLRQVLTMLRDKEVTFKLKNCLVFAEKLSYLSHFIWPGELELSVAKTAAKRKIMNPTTQNELRSFLSFCNLFRRFVPKFWILASQLNKELHEDQPSSVPSFNSSKQYAVEILKTLLRKPPILALACAADQLKVGTDVWHAKVGVVLLQQ